MAGFLVARGCASFIASDGGPLLQALTAAGVSHVPIQVGDKAPWAILVNAVRLARLIDSEDIDIVHAHSRTPAWVGLLACRISARRPPFVTTFHGLYGHRSALKRWYNRVMLRGAAVIANSDFIRRHIIEVYSVPNELIVTAPRGFEEAEFDPSAFGEADRASVRAEFGVPDGFPLLLMVGRLARWKGQHVLLAALARTTDLPWFAVFVGAGAPGSGYPAELKSALESSALGDRVAFAGSRRDVARLNYAADLAFSCSVSPEGFGCVSVEAQAMATPVIASAHGGSLETIVDGETGWLVPPGDIEALEAAIRAALADPGTLRVMGARARRYVLARFTMRRTCEIELSVYERILGVKITAAATKLVGRGETPTSARRRR